MNIFFVSLGCDKNLVDSENMLGLMAGSGCTITDDETQADVIVVNTCCFIDDAKQESINTILEMSEYRKNGRCKVLIAAGCMAQRYKQEIIDEIPEVDAVLGTMAYDKIMEAVNEAMGGHHFADFEDTDRKLMLKGKRMLTTGGHYAYLKIAEGCDKHCTYCVIPSVRGHFRSFPKEDLIAEAKQLVEAGVKELVLVAQETTLYGTDLYGKKCLHELVHELAQIEELKWIRVLYAYPEEIYDEFIEEMKNEPKLCNYLDLPIQHCSDRILRRMARRTSKKDLIDIVTKLRNEVPDIILRTTLITGFPGETEEEHEELKEFIDEMEFNRLGVFTYSQEDGTPAAAMPDQVDEEVKKIRQAELMELQQEISADLEDEMIGRELEVMIEGQVSGENAYICRTYGDAPGVDGYLFLNTDETFFSGDFATVKVTGADDYDLIGELVK